MAVPPGPPGRPGPPDRRDVHPHHLLRAVLDDALVRQVVVALGADPDAVRISLDRRWLDGAEVLDVEEVTALGIDVATVLRAMTPPWDRAGQTDWEGRRLTAATRDVLVLALREQAVAGSTSASSGHLLLGLLACRDRYVAGALTEHGLRLRAARPLVRRWTRRVD